MSKKKTQEQFEKEVMEKTGGKFKVIGKYINADSNIAVKGIECGHEFEIRPCNLLKRKKCTKCSYIDRARNYSKGRPRENSFPNEFYIKKPLIYIATNKINGLIYVGSTTVSLAERALKHKRNSNNKNSNNYNTPFVRAIREFGFESFEWEVIQFWDDEETLADVEDLWIINLKSYKEDVGYNRILNNLKLSEIKLKSKRLEKQRIREFVKDNYKPHCREFGAVALAKRFDLNERTIRNYANIESC